MKYLITNILLSFIIHIHAQERSFAPPEAVWRYTIGYEGGINASDNCEWETCADRGRMYVEKDTIIDGRTVAILRLSRGGDDGDEQSYGGRLLVTTAGEQVFNYIVDSFYLLYDFAAVDGDTLTVGLPTNLDGFTGPYLEDTTILTGQVVVSGFGEYLVYESIDYDFRMDGIVPGIGQFPGSLFSVPTVTMSSFCFGRSICYSDSLQTVGFNGDCGCEWPSLEANAVNDELGAAVSIYPNPVSGTLFVESEIAWKGLTITSVTGQVILQSSYNQFTDINDITSGIYLLTLVDQQGLTFSKKFVKL